MRGDDESPAPSELSIARAREWLTSQQPLLTWAPLWGANGKQRRHAWLADGLKEQTVCGVNAAPPNAFAGRSDVEDCEDCRDFAARSLAKLLDEVRARPAVLAVTESNEARAAAFCRRHRYHETTEAMDDLAAEFERARQAALRDAAEWCENVSRRTASHDRSAVAFECVNVIRARARDRS